MRLASFAFSVCLFLACGGDDSAPTVDAAPQGADAGPQGDAGAEANACKTAGGLCVSSDGDCTGGGGSIVAAGAPGCVFDDGQGTCCAPPAAMATGESCEAQGGLCAPIAGCNFVDGSFASTNPTCGGGPGSICCLPESICGVEDVICCGPGPSADFRPICDRGSFTCSDFPGTELKPIAECPQ